MCIFSVDVRVQQVQVNFDDEGDEMSPPPSKKMRMVDVREFIVDEAEENDELDEQADSDYEWMSFDNEDNEADKRPEWSPAAKDIVQNPTRPTTIWEYGKQINL